MAGTVVTEETLKNAKDFDCIRFTIFDINGIPRGRSVLATNVETYLKNGIDLYYGTMSIGPSNELLFDLPGIQDSNLGNMTIIPANNKIYELPWAGGKHKVGQIICETVYKGKYQPMNPRTVCRKQLKHLDDLGLSLMSAFECEFTMYNYDDPKEFFYKYHAYATERTMVEYESFLLEMNSAMKQAGIGLEALQCEYSGSQLEITLTPKFGIETADMTSRFKQGVKEICRSQKFAVASFMTKADIGALCNGFHYNHSLWNKDGKSALYDPGYDNKLSMTGQYWLAGLLKHARAITALCSPTFNCYRRLHIPWSPNKANWGFENRNSCFRAKNNGPDGTYFENRLPSSACCPYLVIAATVAAGIDGIINKMELPKEADSQAEEIPHTLEEAVSALQEDSVLCEALGKEFIDWFIPMKQANCIRKFKDHNVKEMKSEEIMKERESYFLYL